MSKVKFQICFQISVCFAGLFLLSLSRCVAWVCISCVYVIVCMCASTYIHVYHDTMLKCDMFLAWFSYDWHLKWLVFQSKRPIMDLCGNNSRDISNTTLSVDQSTDDFLFRWLSQRGYQEQPLLYESLKPGHIAFRRVHVARFGCAAPLFRQSCNGNRHTQSNRQAFILFEHWYSKVGMAADTSRSARLHLSQLNGCSWYPLWLNFYFLLFLEEKLFFCFYLKEIMINITN